MSLNKPACSLQVETIRSNVIGCLNLADVCNSKGIHMLYYGTGCIFHYDDDFPMNSGKGFKESDKPNFTGSYYSYTKVGTCMHAAAAGSLQHS
jgi:3,5-epimerase/4-reductase